MRLQNRFIPVLVCVAMLTLSGLAKQALVSPDAINVVQLLPDPPTPGSEEGQAELQEMLNLQSTRTDADVARARDEAEFRVTLFANVVGPGFNAKECPRTFALLEQVSHTDSGFSGPAKDHWNRTRPFVEFPQIQPCIQNAKGGSYPSGHSTTAMTIAEVLSELLPAKRAELMERGRQIGWDRVIAGVHYPSDIEAGRVLGHAVAEAILASPQFQAEEGDVKAELEQVEPATQP
jgi:acid phosphatase (class A)